MAKYLDESGVRTLWRKIKDKTDNKFPFYPLNNSRLTNRTEPSSWGIQIGEEIAAWDDDATGGFKLRKNCPSQNTMSLVIDGAVYVNEGQDKVATEKQVNSKMDKSDLTFELRNGNELHIYKK